MAYQIVDNVGVQIQGLVVGNFYSPSANPLPGPGQGNLPMPGDIFRVIFVVGQDVAIINVVQGAHQGQTHLVGRTYPPNTLFKRYALLGGQMPRGIAGGAGLPPVAPVAPVAPVPPVAPAVPAVPIARVAGENNSMGNNRPNNKSSQRSRKRSRKTRRRAHKKTRKN
jgi:hypothetical protein